MRGNKYDYNTLYGSRTRKSRVRRSVRHFKRTSLGGERWRISKIIPIDRPCRHDFNVALHCNLKWYYNIPSADRCGTESCRRNPNRILYTLSHTNQHKSCTILHWSVLCTSRKVCDIIHCIMKKNRNVIRSARRETRAPISHKSLEFVRGPMCTIYNNLMKYNAATEITVRRAKRSNKIIHIMIGIVYIYIYVYELR